MTRESQLEPTVGSRYVRRYGERVARYTPSLYEPTSADWPYINQVHAGLEAEVREVRGKLEPEDHYKLYEMAYFARGPVLEIGRLAGKSTVLLAMGVRDASRGVPIYSIEYDEKLVPVAEKNLASRGLRDLVFFVQGDSSEQVAKLGVVFDTVFIDGDHSYMGVACDILALRGLVAPGGSVMFHDYFHAGNQDPDNGDYGVARAVDMFARGKGLEFRGGFGGIALFEQISTSYSNPPITRPE